MSRRTLVYGGTALALVVALVVAVAVVLYGGANAAQAAGASAAATSVRDPDCDQEGCSMAGGRTAVEDCCGW